MKIKIKKGIIYVLFKAKSLISQNKMLIDSLTSRINLTLMLLISLNLDLNVSRKKIKQDVDRKSFTLFKKRKMLNAISILYHQDICFMFVMTSPVLAVINNKLS